MKSFKGHLNLDIVAENNPIPFINANINIDSISNTIAVMQLKLNLLFQITPEVIRHKQVVDRLRLYNGEWQVV